jgi:hypothetical protein
MLLYNTKEEQNQFDIKIAKRLHNLIAKERRLTTKPNINKWANDIRLLRSVDHVEKEEIEQTVTWYEQHSKDKYTPKIHSALAFRQKYQSIRDAIERDKGPAPRQVDEETRRIIEDNWMQWPHGITQEQVLDFVQLTADNYRRFLYGLQVIIAETCKPNDLKALRLKRFAKYVNDITPSSARFVEQWIITTHRTLRRMPEWHGKLPNWSMTITHRRFERQGKQWAAEWCSDGSAWDVLTERISKELR